MVRNANKLGQTRLLDSDLKPYCPRKEQTKEQVESNT